MPQEKEFETSRNSVSVQHDVTQEPSHASRRKKMEGNVEEIQCSQLRKNTSESESSNLLKDNACNNIPRGRGWKRQRKPDRPLYIPGALHREKLEKKNETLTQCDSSKQTNKEKEIVATTETFTENRNVFKDQSKDNSSVIPVCVEAEKMRINENSDSSEKNTVKGDCPDRLSDLSESLSASQEVHSLQGTTNIHNSTSFSEGFSAVNLCTTNSGTCTSETDIMPLKDEVISEHNSLENEITIIEKQPEVKTPLHEDTDGQRNSPVLVDDVNSEHNSLENAITIIEKQPEVKTCLHEDTDGQRNSPVLVDDDSAEHNSLENEITIIKKQHEIETPLHEDTDRQRNSPVLVEEPGLLSLPTRCSLEKDTTIPDENTLDVDQHAIASDSCPLSDDEKPEKSEHHVDSKTNLLVEAENCQEYSDNTVLLEEKEIRKEGLEYEERFIKKVERTESGCINCNGLESVSNQAYSSCDRSVEDNSSVIKEANLVLGVNNENDECGNVAVSRTLECSQPEDEGCDASGKVKGHLLVKSDLDSPCTETADQKEVKPKKKKKKKGENEETKEEKKKRKAKKKDCKNEETKDKSTSCKQKVKSKKKTKGSSKQPLEGVQCETEQLKNESHADDDDDDSWFKNFNDEGDCLSPELLEELTKKTRIAKPSKHKTQYDYYSLPTKDDNLEDDLENGHIVEIYDFSSDLKTQDLAQALASFKKQGYEIKWVDDTHALAVFSSEIAAKQAVQLCCSPLLKLRPVSQGIPESKTKARRCFDDLQPHKPRPKTTIIAAHRLVTGALGVRSTMSKEERQKEQEKLREAKEQKRQEKQRKAEIWGD